MKGLADAYGRALLTIEIKPAKSKDATPVDVWIDTGFNGDDPLLGVGLLLGLELRANYRTLELTLNVG